MNGGREEELYVPPFSRFDVAYRALLLFDLSLSVPDVHLTFFGTFVLTP
jgi:hypothetical protein